MERYRCHKVVEAAKILLVDDTGLELADGASVGTTPEWLHRHRPEVGGYFVRYEDGYLSYSPARAFESGYRLMFLPTEPTERKDAPSAGPFVLSEFLIDGRPIESVEDVIKVMAGSAEQSTLAELYGVSLSEAYADGTHGVVCYTGNGPRSAANARLISQLLEEHRKAIL
jgi:hypothetical protein